MQLERGKAAHGLVGSFQAIIKEEGYVAYVSIFFFYLQFRFARFGRLYRGAAVLRSGAVRTKPL